MKKSAIVICLLWAGACFAQAQNVVSGTVTDRQGNPVPGAKVVIAGGTESVITELDGTFRLESQDPAKKVQVFYSGMQPKKQTVKPDMVIRLSRTNLWNRKPDKAGWLVGVQAAFPEPGVSNSSFGLMLGRVKNFGWYVKGVYSPAASTDIDYVAYPDDSDLISYWTTGQDKRSFYSVSAGLAARLHCPVHLYLGAGYADRKVAWQLADGTYARNTDYSYSGVALDYGLMLRLGKFTVNGGTIMCIADGFNFVGNVGVGVCF